MTDCARRVRDSDGMEFPRAGLYGHSVTTCVAEAYAANRPRTCPEHDAERKTDALVPAGGFLADARLPGVVVRTFCAQMTTELTDDSVGAHRQPRLARRIQSPNQSAPDETPLNREKLCR